MYKIMLEAAREHIKSRISSSDKTGNTCSCSSSSSSVVIQERKWIWLSNSEAANLMSQNIVLVNFMCWCNAEKYIIMLGICISNLLLVCYAIIYASPVELLVHKFILTKSRYLNYFPCMDVSTVVTLRQHDRRAMIVIVTHDHVL